MGRVWLLDPVAPLAADQSPQFRDQVPRTRGDAGQRQNPGSAALVSLRPIGCTFHDTKRRVTDPQVGEQPPARVRWAVWAEGLPSSSKKGIR